MHSRVTMADVAHAAGVSLKSVSRVINREPNVSRRLREKVDSAIAKLGYEPDYAARSLAGSRNFTVALLEYSETLQAGHYIRLQIYRGAYAACGERGYQFRIHSLRSLLSEEEPGEIARALARNRADGFLVVPPVVDDPVLLDALSKDGRPFVRFAPALQPERSPYVEVDDRAAGAMVAEMFAEHGHRRFGLVAGPDVHGRARFRREGFVSRLPKLQPEAELFEEAGDFSFRSGMLAAGRLLVRCGAGTAIFATNDEMALGVIAAVREAGLRMPEDISVCGFDDAPSAVLTWPPLTTVRQPITEMTEAAIALLIDGPKVAGHCVRLETALIERGTVARV